MSRPPLEVADLIRVAGQRFIEASRRWISGQHLKVLAAIERCRTAEAQDESSRTCEICGQPGKQRETGGWVRARCDKHAQSPLCTG